MDETSLNRRARELRNNSTPFEVILWRHLSNSKLGGAKFRRQTVIGPFICDFFCPAKGLIIEIDGDTHDPHANAKRDAAVAEKGFKTLRFSNADVANNIDGVLFTILDILTSTSDRWGSPHPNPQMEAGDSIRPEGEGLKG